MNTDAPTLLDNVAYGYDEFGWSFTPLSGKRPTLSAWQKRPRENRQEALEWAERGNVGLRTGETSGIVVIDVDPGAKTNGLNLPATVTVRTGRDGRHYYFRTHAHIPNSASKLGKHIDVRGDGGQVVYPGSVHPGTGRRYEWHPGHEPWNVEIAELPEALISLLTAKRGTKRPTPPPNPQKPPTSHVRASRYAESALRREVSQVVQAPEGQRNDVLNTAAFNLGTLIGGGYLTESEVEGELRSAGEAAGLEWGEIVATVASGLNAGKAEPRKIATRANAADRPAVSHEDRDNYILSPGPHVTDKGKYIEQSWELYTKQIIQALPPGALYRRGDENGGVSVIGEIVGEEGRRAFLRVKPARMMVVADEHARCGRWRQRKTDDEPVFFYENTKKVWAECLIEQGRRSEKIRRLDRLVSYPVYREGWTLAEPGWHDGMFYDEPPELAGLEPIRDPEHIYQVLHELVIDFPFREDADEHNFFGLLLTPIIAPAVEGNRPLHLLLSSLERTGKSKLAEEVWGGVIQGRTTEAVQWAEREEEREKRLTALLLDGSTLVHLDNLPRYIDSQSMSSLVTASTLRTRILGRSESPRMENHLTVCASGNNVEGSGELAKRIVPIRLQPATSHPERRRDFHHPNLRAYVREQRRLVVSCLIGMVQNWIDASRPLGVQTLGGFEEWCKTVGGILKMNGFGRWLTNAADWQTEADPKGAEMEAFVEAWAETFGTQATDASDLRQYARDEGFFTGIFAKPTEAARYTAFGRLLSRHRDTPVGEWIVRREDASSRRSVYRLERINESE